MAENGRGAKSRAPVLHDMSCRRGQIFPGEHRPYDATCSRCRYLMDLGRSVRHEEPGRGPDSVNLRSPRKVA